MRFQQRIVEEIGRGQGEAIGIEVLCRHQRCFQIRLRFGVAIDLRQILLAQSYHLQIVIHWGERRSGDRVGAASA